MLLVAFRRSLSVIKVAFLFGLLWLSVLFYVSIFEAGLLKKMNSREVKSENSALHRISSEFTRNFLMEKEMKIKTFRELFNLSDPGAMGEDVILPKNLPSEIQKLIDEGWKDYTINEFVSELIPLSRSLPDIRSDYCKHQVYENLPKASVIIIFHNEAWSMILRTMHSVLDRSPSELLEEIVLVDDCSDRGC